MSEKIKAVLKIFAMLIAAVLIFAAAFICWLTFTEYKPAPSEPIEIEGLDPQILEKGKNIRLLSFNIGYCNLGEESDFFMDGGENIRNGDKELVQKNLEGVLEIIDRADADIMLIQEADVKSTRSFNMNQVVSLAQSTEGNSAFAPNYVCGFVPFPWPPIGKVESGIMTLSLFAMEEAERISLPCPFSWPVSAANLKRCLLISRYNIEGTEKQLVTVNLHLEAYDDGEGKIAQTKMLWDILETEYEKGNYVVAGGDFNQTFPGAIDKFPLKDPDFWAPGVLSEDDLPRGWRYVYDDSLPTCRLLNKPYNPDDGSAQYYVIDGFIISPNVELLSAKTLDYGFRYSDHSPVLMEISLKENELEKTEK
ncbi:MAG: endonuclease/exonuclease/phosphatase family protein [Oscillospiraceae bacterium]|nr:endonuclease/exonuclease/phosphatase family protein [Oscillospiraceae bacterium]